MQYDAPIGLMVWDCGKPEAMAVEVAADKACVPLKSEAGPAMAGARLGAFACVCTGLGSAACGRD